MEQSQKKFLKNLVGFSMVTWISFVLGFIASPISTRLFAPEELAKVTLFSSYTNLFCSVSYLGLDQAFVRFFRETPGRLTRRSLFTFCLGVSLGFCLVASAIMSFFWRGVSAEITGAPDLPAFLCLCLFTFFTILYRFLSLCYRMEQNAAAYTVQGVLHVLLTKIAYLAAGFRSPLGRSAILLMTLLMGLFTLAYVLLQRSRFGRGFWTALDKPALQAVGSYALPLVPLSLFSWATSTVSTLALKHLLGYAAAGIYASALGLASTINIVQTGFNTYWAPYVLENYQSDDSRRFFTVHRLMACLLTLFGLTITLLQTPVFLLLGKSYRSAVVFFPFLFVSPICYCLGETTGMGITISKKTYWTTLIYLVSAVLNIGLCYVFIPPMGMPGAALAAAVSAILTLLLRTRIGEIYYRVLQSYRYLAYVIGLMLAASFVNLLLSGAVKYALLLSILALACALFRREIATLLHTFGSLLVPLKKRLHKKG